MARGFLSGVLWGGVFSLGVSGVVSVLAPLPPPPEVADAAPGVAAAPDQIGKTSTGEQASQSDTALATGQGASQTLAPEPDTLAGIDADTETSAAVPVTGDAEDLQTPDNVTDIGGAVPSLDEPVLPNPQALAPAEPQVAEQLSISTEPAQPPAPQTGAIQGAFDAPTQPETDETSAQEAALPAATAVAPSSDETRDPDRAEPAIAPVAPPPNVTDGENPDNAEALAKLDTASERPAIGTPAGSLTERDGVVPVNRLTGDPAPEAEAETTEETPAPVATAPSDAKPITAFAQDFGNPENKPLMGIVLIDEGVPPSSGAADIAALRSFPYPVSIAVDSRLPDAADRMAQYRAEGFEVLAMVDLPEGAAPTDAETTFGATLANLSEVVGVLEGSNGGLQGSRQVSDQVAAILAQTGHGLVTQDRGLNTMPKLARKSGVPADPIFRDFDSKGQTPQVIRRFLDQAAFRAGQEGSVIMLGRLRPDTISALLLWGLQNRAGQVALAPISAVLLRE